MEMYVHNYTHKRFDSKLINSVTGSQTKLRNHFDLQTVCNIIQYTVLSTAKTNDDKLNIIIKCYI